MGCCKSSSKREVYRNTILPQETRQQENYWTDKHLAKLTGKKEKNQINKIRNEKGELTTDNAEIQRIMRDYFEQLYGNKMDNLEEMTDS